METRGKAWHWQGSPAGFLRSAAVAAAGAIAIATLLFAAVTPTGEFALTSEATAAQGVARPHRGTSAGDQGVAPRSARSNLNILAKAALWNSTGLRLETGDAQGAAAE